MYVRRSECPQFFLFAYLPVHHIVSYLSHEVFGRREFWRQTCFVPRRSLPDRQKRTDSSQMSGSVYLDAHTGHIFDKTPVLL